MEENELEQRYQMKVAGFSLHNRIQFLNYILNFGLEGRSIQDIYDKFCEFSDITDIDNTFFKYFIKYFILFLSVLLQIDQFKDDKKIFCCGLGTSLVQRRIVGINLLSLACKNFKKNRPYQVINQKYETFLKNPKIKNWCIFDDYLLFDGISKYGYDSLETILNKRDQ